MFNEKNISKLIIITPIFTIILLVSLILYSFVKTQQSYFSKESATLEKNYMEQQKVILKKEVNDVLQYIKYQKNLTFINEKKDIHIQMKAFIKKISQELKNPKNYIKYIKMSANDNVDFIIFDKQKKKIFKEKDVFFNTTLLQNKNAQSGGFVLQDRTNLFFFKNIPSTNITVILKKDIFYKVDSLKNSIARWMELLKFEKSNDMWIYTNTNKLIADTHRIKDIGNDDTYKKNIKNRYFVQKLVRLAVKNRAGDFIEFYPSNINKSKKLGFAKLYKDWNWVIGSGIFINEIEKNIELRKKSLQAKIDAYIETTIIIAAIFIIIISLLSLLISYKISKTFQNYQEKVNKKEAKLKELNKTLHSRIKEAIEASKEKDRAMLHQSRLARMGNMINMIAHQWRQPLSILSGIIMEMETKVIFKKSSEVFLLNCAKDATKIIQFMSLTIEDFRNFFKPGKDKELFSISQACEEAINLIKASLDNQNIELQYNVKNDKSVNGYKIEYSQVILNLLLNAKDAIIANETEGGIINLSVDIEDGKSVVTLQDNAGGVNKEDIDLIFEPYFSTKKSQGTGLGLYMSKMIIEQNMQGQISVKNYKNGAIFKVIL